MYKKILSLSLIGNLILVPMVSAAEIPFYLKDHSVLPQKNSPATSEMYHPGEVAYADWLIKRANIVSQKLAECYKELDQYKEVQTAKEKAERDWVLVKIKKKAEYLEFLNHKFKTLVGTTMAESGYVYEANVNQKRAIAESTLPQVEVSPKFYKKHKNKKVSFAVEAHQPKSEVSFDSPLGAPKQVIDQALDDSMALDKDPTQAAGQSPQIPSVAVLDSQQNKNDENPINTTLTSPKASKKEVANSAVLAKTAKPHKRIVHEVKPTPVASVTPPSAVVVKAEVKNEMLKVMDEKQIPTPQPSASSSVFSAIEPGTSKEDLRQKSPNFPTMEPKLEVVPTAPIIVLESSKKLSPLEKDSSALDLANSSSVSAGILLPLASEADRKEKELPTVSKLEETKGVQSDPTVSVVTKTEPSSTPVPSPSMDPVVISSEPPQASPSPSFAPAVVASPEPTSEPSVQPSASPSQAPSIIYSPEPTADPSVQPSPSPTSSPAPSPIPSPEATKSMDMVPTAPLTVEPPKEENKEPKPDKSKEPKEDTFKTDLMEEKRKFNDLLLSRTKESNKSKFEFKEEVKKKELEIQNQKENSVTPSEAVHKSNKIMEDDPIQEANGPTF